MSLKNKLLRQEDVPALSQKVSDRAHELQREDGSKIGSQLRMREDEGNYDVERKGDLVSIGLGFVPAFEVPRDTAIKLAALILKATGCGVTISSNCLTASWRKLDG